MSLTPETGADLNPRAENNVLVDAAHACSKRENNVCKV